MPSSSAFSSGTAAGKDSSDDENWVEYLSFNWSLWNDKVLFDMDPPDFRFLCQQRRGLTKVMWYAEQTRSIKLTNYQYVLIQVPPYLRHSFWNLQLEWISLCAAPWIDSSFRAATIYDSYLDVKLSSIKLCESIKTGLLKIYVISITSVPPRGITGSSSSSAWCNTKLCEQRLTSLHNSHKKIHW